MEIIQTIILGAVQGITEFLPISSSGHLVLIPWFFDWPYQGLTFDVALHFGTLLAVIIYFFKDWLSIFYYSLIYPFYKNTKMMAWVSKPFVQYDRKILWLIIIATIPGALAGYFLNDLAEKALRHPLLIAFNLFFFGALLFLADNNFQHRRNLKLLSLKNTLLIGFSQALAILPGVSRSGITITTGLALGFNRKSAARFSFLMATPIIFGASLYKLPDFLSAPITPTEISGIIVSAIFGYLAIAGLIKFIEKVSYRLFFWYRLALAILILAFYYLGS